MQSWKGSENFIDGIREADDIDLAIRFSKGDFVEFKSELIRCINESDISLTPGQRKTLIENIKKNNDKLQYNEIFNQIPIDDSDFAHAIAEVCKDYCRYVPKDGKTKIGFAIILKEGKYDGLPELPLKF
jgi:hypothetical protein